MVQLPKHNKAANPTASRSLMGRLNEPQSEIDHLTTLLHSRTVENSDVTEDESEPKLSDLQVVHASRGKISNLTAHENRIKHALSPANSTPEMKFEVLADDVASPAEIAKADMGNRRTKVSLSVTPLQNQLPIKELHTPYNPLSRSLAQTTSLTQKPVNDIGISSNGFMTSRYRGRSAIYRMARTPYSRFHPVTSHKAAAETDLNIGNGSLNHNATGNNHSKKQVLKRRSSFLENDIGSVGPIHRIRQKPNFLHSKNLSLPQLHDRQPMDESGVLSNVAGVSHSTEWSTQNRYFSKVVTESSLPVTSSKYDSSQSIEIAQKNFLQLDKFNSKRNVEKENSVVNSPAKEPGMESEDSSDRLSPCNSVAILDALPQDQSIPVGKPSECSQLGKKELESLANGSKDAKTTAGLGSASNVAAEPNGLNKTDHKTTQVWGNAASKPDDPASQGNLPVKSQTDNTTLTSSVLLTGNSTFSNGNAQPTFSMPSSGTFSTSHQSMSTTAPHLSVASGSEPLTRTGGESNSIGSANPARNLPAAPAQPFVFTSGGNSASFSAPSLENADVPSAVQAPSNTFAFPVQTGNAPISVPGFPGQSASSVSNLASTSSSSAPIFGTSGSFGFNTSLSFASSSSGNPFGLSSSVFTSSSTTSSMAGFTSQFPKPTTTIAPASPSALFSGNGSATPLDGFVFNATPAVVSPFQLDTQSCQVASVNPFQPSNSFEFDGGNFKIGGNDKSLNNDKSKRRMIKVKRLSKK